MYQYLGMIWKSHQSRVQSSREWRRHDEFWLIAKLILDKIAVPAVGLPSSAMHPAIADPVVDPYPTFEQLVPCFDHDESDTIVWV
jgi:hypothetical protein